jgi:RimJ/RimL family protein N-acetyltransferase
VSDGIILLDAHRIDDAEAHLRGEDEVMRGHFDADRPATLEETQHAIERWIAARAAGGPMFAYALRDPSGLLMGGCELRMRSASTANVSYWLFPSFRGHGYAVRALALLSAAARQVAGLNRLEARISPDNEPSLRVARKAAFTYAGTMQEKVRGGLSTMRVYVKDIRDS